MLYAHSETGKLRITIDGKEYVVDCDVSRSASFNWDQVILRFRKESIPVEIKDGVEYEIDVKTNVCRGTPNVYVGKAAGGFWQGYQLKSSTQIVGDHPLRHWFITIPNDGRGNCWSSDHPALSPEEIKLAELSSMFGELHAMAMNMAKIIEKMREVK